MVTLRFRNIYVIINEIHGVYVKRREKVLYNCNQLQSGCNEIKKRRY